MTVDIWKKMSYVCHGVPSPRSHRCNRHCLGPLTFHPEVVGDMVRLSHGHRQADRNKDTFKGGLVFSSRPLKPQERLCVIVGKRISKWMGSLRVGFTSVSPSARSLPLPPLAIPALTDTPGHWAFGLDEALCEVGSKLEFWFSHGGNMYISINKTQPKKILAGLDVSQPLWAMIDIYGQALCIILKGSEKRGLIHRRSCPAPEALVSPDCDNGLRLVADVSAVDEDSDEDSACGGMDISDDNSCVVCMVKEARVTLACGHCCLCKQCCIKVSQQFGTCPLCRHHIRAPSEPRRRVGALC